MTQVVKPHFIHILGKPINHDIFIDYFITKVDAFKCFVDFNFKKQFTIIKKDELK